MDNAIDKTLYRSVVKEAKEKFELECQKLGIR